MIFARAEEARALEALGLAVRVDFQYHWRNEGYRTPDDFLARFASKRRNAIKRERAAPARQGIAIRTVRGDELTIGVAGLDEFEIGEFSSEVADAEKLLKLGIGSPTLKKQVLKRLASKYLCDVRQEIKDQISEEIDVWLKTS